MREPSCGQRLLTALPRLASASRRLRTSACLDPKLHHPLGGGPHDEITPGFENCDYSYCGIRPKGVQMPFAMIIVANGRDDRRIRGDWQTQRRRDRCKLHRGGALPRLRSRGRKSRGSRSESSFCCRLDRAREKYGGVPPDREMHCGSTRGRGNLLTFIAVGD